MTNLLSALDPGEDVPILTLVDQSSHGLPYLAMNWNFPNAGSGLTAGDAKKIIIYIGDTKIDHSVGADQSNGS